MPKANGKKEVKEKKEKRKPIKNAIVISDLHCGCQMALCPPKVKLDTGGKYEASHYQMKIWECWQSFWNEWVPRVTRDEPYCVVLNGDALDGRHHNAVTQISQNLADQHNIAMEILGPITEKCNGKLYFIRGTEAHVGPAAENEERLARELKTVTDENGNYSRFELYLDLGGCLAHFNHHIGTTGSMHYESTALMKEYTEFCADSARWARKLPDIVIRSHRHRKAEIKVPSHRGEGICFTTAGWQLRTPFVYRIPGGRITTPMIGGSLVRQGDEEFYARHQVWETKRPKTSRPRIEVAQ